MTVTGLILLLGIVFIVSIAAGINLTQQNLARIKEKAERALEDQELRILETRQRAKEVKEFALKEQENYRIMSQSLTDCGEVICDDYWVDPVATQHANKIIPAGFQAVTTCVVCGEYATHWIEKVDGRDIIRKCIMEKCQGTWTERK